MDVIQRIVRTSDGRDLAVEEGGDPSGRPILVHGGTPNSRHLYGPHLANAAERGIRLLSYDRPGYGGSTPQPSRTVADRVADVSAIADALEIDKLAIWGISGGGPYALACAAVLHQRVVAVASLASIAPYDAPGLDYFTGMGRQNADDIRHRLDNPGAAKAKCIKDREGLQARTAEGLLKHWQTLLTPTDAAVLTGDLADYFVRCARDGLAQGIDGWWDEGDALIRPWGFDLDTIRVPVMLWHGREDQFVPFQHGEWLAGQIPSVEAHLTGQDGHLTLIQSRVPVVHAWLLRYF